MSGRGIGRSHLLHFGSLSVPWIPHCVVGNDIDCGAVELRAALEEEHAVKENSRISPVKDAHLFLILDKNVQGIPWESILILRGK